MGLHHHHHLTDREVGEDQTGARAARVSLSLLGTLLGGALLLNSIIATYLYPYGENHAELMAFVGAILLAAPVIYHAIQNLISGHYHMDELVALALIAAVTATLFGTVLGALSAYFGRWVDVGISQVINLVLIVPALRMAGLVE